MSWLTEPLWPRAWTRPWRPSLAGLESLERLLLEDPVCGEAALLDWPLAG